MIALERPGRAYPVFVRRQRNLHDPPIDRRPALIGRNCTYSAHSLHLDAFAAPFGF
jgi:hypothetical protein